MAQETPTAANTANTAPLRVAVIGYGLAGVVFHAPLIAATPGMRVAAIVTADPERQTRARHDFPEASVYDSADALFAHASDLDLVVVAAPNRAHVSLGIAALEAGLPVVIDKPVAPSSAEAKRLVAAAKTAEKPVVVFQNRRWDNDFLTVRRLIDTGLLGRVTRFESRFERFAPVLKGGWRERPAPEEAGGLLFDLGAHLIDQAMQLFGPPTTVYAETALQRPSAQVDDDAFVALRFAGGEVAHLWMSVVPRRSAPRMRVVGLRGVYEKYHLDPQEPALKDGAHPGDPGWGSEPRERWGTLTTEVGGLAVESVVETLPGAYEQFYLGVRDAIHSGGPLPVTMSSVLAALRVIEAAHESARTGTVVRLKP